MDNLLKERVAELCEERGITINKLEQMANLSQGSIKHWDDHKPSIDKVQRVAEIFGVSVDYLLGNTDEDDEVIAIRKQLREKPEMRTLLDASRKCTVEEIEALTEMIEKWKR